MSDSVPTSASTAILPGAFFTSWTALKTKVQNWAIAEHFSFSVPKKTVPVLTIAVVIRNLDVPGKFMQHWHLLAKLKRKLSSVNTCAGSKQTPREVANTQFWFRRTVPKHLFVTRDTEVREIVECMQLHYNVRVNREAAWLIQAFLIQDRLEHQQEQLCQISAYLALLRSKNPFLYCFLHTVGQDAFQRVFICPAQSQLLFRCKNLWLLMVHFSKLSLFRPYY